MENSIFSWIILNSFPWEKLHYNPDGICLLKVNNRSTRIRCDICSKLTTQTPKEHQWHCSGVPIVNFEHISYFVLVFLLLTFNREMLAGKTYHCKSERFICKNIFLCNETVWNKDVLIFLPHSLLSSGIGGWAMSFTSNIV